ncbi:unnamed protein product [Malus baccata var. baccata]
MVVHHITDRVHHITGPFHHRSTILTSQWVTYHGIALSRYSLNFGVPIEPETSELPKSLMLSRDENIHIRFIGSTPLGDVGCYNPSPLRARRPRRHTSGQGLALIPFVTSRPGSTTSWARTHTRTSQWVTHHGIALAHYSLNFGVPMEPETSEFPKNIMLGRDGNIHIRLIGSIPLGCVGCYNPPPFAQGSESFKPYMYIPIST